MRNLYNIWYIAPFTKPKVVVWQGPLFTSEIFITVSKISTLFFVQNNRELITFLKNCFTNKMGVVKEGEGAQSTLA